MSMPLLANDLLLLLTQQINKAKEMGYEGDILLVFQSPQEQFDITICEFVEDCIVLA